MRRTTHNSRYFCGNEISAYGLEMGYLDYGTLAKAFDAVLVNDITKLFYANVNGEFNEAEFVHGFVDNSEELNELREEREELENWLIDHATEIDSAEFLAAEDRVDELNEEIATLESDENYPPEIYQYYIVSDRGAEIIQTYTDDPLFYLPMLDCYVWGVTHWGTAWDYVLTNVKLEVE